MLEYKRNVQTGGEWKLYFKQRKEDQWREIPRSEWAEYWQSECKILKMNLESKEIAYKNVCDELEEASIEINDLKGQILQLNSKIARMERKSTQVS